MPLALFLVLLLSKGITLIGKDLVWSLSSGVAFVWQDALVTLAFLLINRLIPLRSCHVVLYWILIFYTAINVPIIKILSSPLTAPMLRATRGPLADSMRHHVTLETVGSILAVMAAGLFIPYVISRVRSLLRHYLPLNPKNLKHPIQRLDSAATAIFAGVLMAWVALGGRLTGRVETRGLHRNALCALAASFCPRIQAGLDQQDWRQGPFSSATAEDLTHLRGLAQNRNVILLVLESTGANYLGVYGASPDPMPNLTRLAREAVIFENAYAVCPESIKGLFSILTAQAPAFDLAAQAHGHRGEFALPQRLLNSGYRTALFHSGRFGYLGMDAILENRGFEHREDAGDIGGNHQSSFGVDDEATVDRLLTWIDSINGPPFFIAYIPTTGHHPYETPPAALPPSQTAQNSNRDMTPSDLNLELESTATSQDQRRYNRALGYSDYVLQKLMNGLRQRDLEQKTLFMIIGDHGEAFGQHPGNFGHTIFIYEENVRVPLLILIPGVIRETIRVQRIASLLDCAPTLLDLLGLEWPKPCQGRSLLSPEPIVALFFTDYSLGFLGLRDGPWKFIHELDSDRSKLFNLKLDPQERVDLSPQSPYRSAAYRTRLQSWSAAQITRLEGSNPPPPPTE